MNENIDKHEKYREKNRELLRKKGNDYREKNSEAIAEKKREKRKEEPEKYKSISREEGRKSRWKRQEHKISKQKTNLLRDDQWRKDNAEQASATARIRYQIDKGNIIRPTICPKCNEKPKVGIVRACFLTDYYDIDSFTFMCGMCYGAWKSNEFDKKKDE